MAECALERLSSDIHCEIFQYVWPSTPLHRQLALLPLLKRLYPSLRTSFYDWKEFVVNPLKLNASALGRHLINSEPYCKSVKSVQIRSWKAFSASDIEYTLTVLGHIAPVQLSIQTDEFRPALLDSIQFHRLRHLVINCYAWSTDSTAGRWVSLIIRAADTLETLAIEEIGDRSKKGYRKLAASGVTFPKLRKLRLHVPDNGSEWFDSSNRLFCDDMIPFVACLIDKCTPLLAQLDLDANLSPKLVAAILRLQGKHLKSLLGLMPAQLRDYEEDDDDSDGGYASQGAISEDSDGEEEQEDGRGAPGDAIVYGSETLATLTPGLQHLYLQRATETRYADLPSSIRSLHLLLPDEEAKNILARCLTESASILPALTKLFVDTDSEGMEIKEPTVLREACDARNIECIERFL